MLNLHRTTVEVLRLLPFLAVPASFALAQSSPSLPAPFVYLSEIAPDIQQDMRYASANNFLGRRVEGYHDSVCILTEKTARALKQVQEKLKEASRGGLSLKVYDCYRPESAVRDFVHWSQQESSGKAKQQYFPDLEQRDLFKLGYISARSSHSRGNTVDLTIVRIDDAQAQPQDRVARCGGRDRSLDFGTGFDCFDPKSHTWSTDVSAEAQQNRRLLVEAMKAAGFRNYTKEWWHFELEGAAASGPSDFPVRKQHDQPRRSADLTTVLTDSPPGCDLRIDVSGLYSVDCNGKTANIKVLKDLSSQSELGVIVAYDSQYLDACECSMEVVGRLGKQEWCQIRYSRTIDQDFEKGWTLFSALHKAKVGRLPNCTRAAR